jgi:hypothetical protein
MKSIIVLAFLAALATATPLATAVPVPKAKICQKSCFAEPVKCQGGWVRVAPFRSGGDGTKGGARRGGGCLMRLRRKANVCVRGQEQGHSGVSARAILGYGMSGTAEARREGRCIGADEYVCRHVISAVGFSLGEKSAGRDRVLKRSGEARSDSRRRGGTEAGIE